jgi:hypothetical protein
MMRSRKIIIGILAVVVCGVLAVVFWRREPAYGGKKLHAWAELAGTPNGSAYMRIEFLPAPTREAFEAVGPRGMPFYLEWLGYMQSSVIRPEIYLAKRCDQRLGSRWKLEERLQRRAYGAALAIGGLGEQAREAIPRLMTLITNSTTEPSCAYLCLRWIGRPAIPAMISLTTNENIQIRKLSMRDLTISIRAEKIPDPRILDQLRLLLKYPDHETRVAATNSLEWAERLATQRNYHYVFP